MAEGTESNYIIIPSPLSIHPTCQDYALRSYNHDVVTQYSNTYNGAMCQFYLKGLCRFGSNCLFSHSTANNDGQLTLINDKQTTGLLCQQVEAQSTDSLFSLDANKSDIYQPNFNVFSQSYTNMLPTYEPDSFNLVNASEVVPKTTRSSVDSVKSNVSQVRDDSLKQNTNICSKFSNGECQNKEEYQCISVELCELCGKYCFNSFDEAQKKIHIEFNEKKLEDMKLSHTLQRSLNKACLLCADLIMKKKGSERPFALLEKCNHVFCAPCIRKWRKSHGRYGSRACPECGVPSYFYVTSEYLVDAEEKTKLISDYKVTMSQMHCTYFKESKGSFCPKKECLYLHANPDGTKAQLPPSSERSQASSITLGDYLEISSVEVSDNAIDELDSGVEDCPANKNEALHKLRYRKFGQ